MITEIDEDNNGEIDFDGSNIIFLLNLICYVEFVAVMSKKVNASYSADQVKNAFKV